MADEPTTPPAAEVEHQALTEVRIQHIVELMTERGAFVRGKTARELAAEWKLSLARVHKLTALASKRVRAACDTDVIASEVVTTLRTVMRRGLVKRSTYKDANAAANHLAEIYGLKQPRKHELTGAAGGPLTVAATSYDPKQLSDEQLERVARGEPPGPGDPRRSRSGT